jgi:hypothetical protein
VKWLTAWLWTHFKQTLPKCSRPNVTDVLPVAVNYSYCTPDDGYTIVPKTCRVILQWNQDTSVESHWTFYLCACVCVCVCIYIYIYIYKTMYGTMNVKLWCPNNWSLKCIQFSVLTVHSFLCRDYSFSCQFNTPVSFFIYDSSSNSFVCEAKLSAAFCMSVWAVPQTVCTHSAPVSWNFGT